MPNNPRPADPTHSDTRINQCGRQAAPGHGLLGAEGSREGRRGHGPARIKDLTAINFSNKGYLLDCGQGGWVAALRCDAVQWE